MESIIIKYRPADASAFGAKIRDRVVAMPAAPRRQRDLNGSRVSAAGGAARARARLSRVKIQFRNFEGSQPGILALPPPGAGAIEFPRRGSGNVGKRTHALLEFRVGEYSYLRGRVAHGPYSQLETREGGREGYRKKAKYALRDTFGNKWNR